jgi:hypothetical protein
MQSTNWAAVSRNLVQLFVILEIHLIVIQTLWWSLSSDKQTWSPIHLLKLPFLGLVTVFARHYLFVFPLYCIMKWYEFVFVNFFFLSFYIYMNQMVKLYIIDILISILICIHLIISKTDFSNLKILPRVHTFIQSHSFRNSILISNGHHQKDEHLC